MGTDNLPGDAEPSTNWPLDATFRIIIETSPFLYAVVDDQVRFSYVNPAFTTILGYEPAELIGQSAAEITSPEDFELAVSALGQLVDEFDEHPDEGIPIALRLLGKDGSIIHVEVGAIPRLEDPDVRGIIIRGRPMSGQQHLDQALEALVASSPLDDVLDFLVTSIEHELLGVHAAICYGWDGRTFTSVVAHALPPSLCGTVDESEADLVGLDAPWAMALASHQTAVYPTVESLPLGVRKTASAAGLEACWVVPVPVPPDNAQLACITVWRAVPGRPFVSHTVALDRASRLISLAFERRHTEELLHHAAMHDTLTGIANRSQFFQRLETLTAARHRDDYMAVLYLDLDGFKTVNDTFGHSAGDQVLRTVTDRVAANVRPNDLVARLGGDEFAVLCSSVTSASEATAIAERLIHAIDQPIEAGPHPVKVGVSIGIALAHPHDTNGSDLLDAADGALYDAKRAGKGRWRMAPSTIVLD